MKYHLDFMNCINSIIFDYDCDKESFKRLVAKNKKYFTLEAKQDLEYYLNVVLTNWGLKFDNQSRIDTGIALVTLLDILSENYDKPVADYWFKERWKAEKTFKIDHFQHS